MDFTIKTTCQEYLKQATRETQKVLFTMRGFEWEDQRGVIQRVNQKPPPENNPNLLDAPLLAQDSHTPDIYNRHLKREDTAFASPNPDAIPYQALHEDEKYDLKTEALLLKVECVSIILTGQALSAQMTGNFWMEKRDIPMR
eukprot:TRINITY_DN7090_c0_g1_i1.p1 TRINITY_DN7090_c0_g1~~TRINITY_DN7090_c0_g1_i1.p1  ORF type:complete len:142 (-),score=22.48 TRINITY_DN7090_c0_g1_i1:742-1167(-)